MESSSCMVMDYLKLRQFCCKSGNKVTLSLHRSCFSTKLPCLSRHLVWSKFSRTISFRHARISNEVSCALIPRLSQLRPLICYVSWTVGTVDCRRQKWMPVISICPSCLESSCGSFCRHTELWFSTDVTNFHSHCLHKSDRRSLAIGAFCQWKSHATHTVLSLLTMTIKTNFKLWKVYPVSFWVTRHRHFWTELKLSYVCRFTSPQRAVSRIWNEKVAVWTFTCAFSIP
jgi:hypothetical protein